MPLMAHSCTASGARTLEAHGSCGGRVIGAKWQERCWSWRGCVAAFCWNIANYVAAIVKEDGCHVRVKEGYWCSIYSPLTLSKKKATMVGCWWQPTTIFQCQSLVSLAATIVDKGARGAVIEAYK